MKDDLRVRAGTTWYIWLCAIAVTCSGVGSAWDISWHKSIGRDTFWTAPHILIYLCGVIAGLTSGYMILDATFRRDSPLRKLSVSVWGFRGPLGAFLCAWGGIAMITSAPFDNWWHNAYGLDVKVLSPPHVVLALGMLAIRLGTLLLIAAQVARGNGGATATLKGLLLYSFASILALSIGMFQELTIRPYMHSGLYYLVAAIAVPVWFAVIGMVVPHRWACTWVAVIYTLYLASFIWILPLFEASPKLGPVFQTVTRFVPPDFPMMLLVSAVAMDLVRHRFRDRSKWLQAAVGGAAFLLTFIAVQWPFANFLQSPASRNWMFGTQHVPFFVPSSSDYVRYAFTSLEQGAEFWWKMACAFGVAIVMTRVGLTWGNAVRRLQR